MKMKIPLLLYHDIKADDYDLRTVEPSLKPYILKKTEFLRQMEWLYNQGYRVVSLDELRGMDLPANQLNTKTVCLVFDDGWLSNYEIAYPSCLRFGFKATFFVTIENIGRQEMMGWPQIQELAKNKMTIGSHSITHRIPIRLSDKELEYELSESKRILEEKINKKVEFFSTPTGFNDKRIEKIAKQSGYKGMCVSLVEVNPAFNKNSDFVILKKIGIRRNYSFRIFKGIVEGKIYILLSLRLKQRVRNIFKSILGIKNYLQLKSFILKNAI